MPTYTYSLATDFGGIIALSQFQKEIEDSSIVPTLDKIDLNDDDVKTEFDSSLSAGEITTLDGLVSAHTIISAGATISGPYYDYFESLAESSTTSETFVQKASFNTKYYTNVTTPCKIEWYYRVASDGHDKYMQFRIQVDDTTTIHDEYRELFLGDLFQRQIMSGFVVMNLTHGQHTIDFDFLTTNNGKTVKVSDLRIMVTEL